MVRGATGGGNERWLVRATFAVEAIAVALLAYVLAQLVWAPFKPQATAPIGAFDGAPAQVATVAARDGVNPFRRSGGAGAQVDPLAAAPETTLNLKLVGVRAASEGQAGAAILQTPDNQQRLYRVGDVIVNGVTLAAVEANRVVILRDGARESVLFTERRSLIGGGGAPPAVAAAGPAPAAAQAEPARSSARVPAGSLLQGLALEQGSDGGVIAMPRGDGTALAAAGLKPGDVVRSVNGIPLDSPETWGSTFAGVGPGARVTVVVERAGQPVTIDLVLE